MKQKLLPLAAILAALLTLRPRGVTLANIAEGTHLSSQGITFEADGAITERNLLVKRGSASNRIALCGAADTPIGVCSDEAAAAAADLVNVVVAFGGIGNWKRQRITD